MAIDILKIHEVVELCKGFLCADRVTLHQFQSLVGKLFHVSKCTCGARAFLARVLDLLRLAERAQVVVVMDAARADAAWFVAYLQNFNGVTAMKPETAQFVAEVDSLSPGWRGGLRWSRVLCPQISCVYH